MTAELLLLLSVISMIHHNLNTPHAHANVARMHLTEGIGKNHRKYCNGSIEQNENTLQYYVTTPRFIKKTPYLIAHNFGKCRPIFKFFSPSDLAVIV